MMKLLYSRAGKTKNPDDETRTMINTYGKKVSFINFDSLNKIVSNIWKMAVFYSDLKK